MLSGLEDGARNARLPHSHPRERLPGRLGRGISQAHGGAGDAQTAGAGGEPIEGGGEFLACAQSIAQGVVHGAHALDEAAPASQIDTCRGVVSEGRCACARCVPRGTGRARADGRRRAVRAQARRRRRRGRGLRACGRRRRPARGDGCRHSFDANRRRGRRRRGRPCATWGRARDAASRGRRTRRTGGPLARDRWCRVQGAGSGRRNSLIHDGAGRSLRAYALHRADGPGASRTLVEPSRRELSPYLRRLPPSSPLAPPRSTLRAEVDDGVVDLVRECRSRRQEEAERGRGVR